ncbi:hypothetical protein T439DRAFT_318945 [Meredithblackwellia eburnea MCA 4105]
MLRKTLQLKHSNARLLSTSTNNVVAIRAEAAERRWERRVPLSPKQVEKLTRDGVTCLVQPSEKRVWNDQLYKKAGAHITSDLSDAKIILGIKEIPASTLTPDKTYAFFSHTHKGQAYNLGLLQTMLDTRSSRFIDWELLTDDTGVRTTAFGWLAGFSGMSDGLSQLGTKILGTLGVATPFLELARPYMVKDVANVKENLKRIGEGITRDGFGKSLGPVVIVIAGRGRVGSGAKAVLDELPTKWVKAEELKSIAESPNPDLHRIFACQLELGDYLTNKDGVTPFDRETYRNHPDQFFSEFDTKIAPYTTALLNGAFWEPGCPRMLSTSQLANIQATAPSNRFLSVIDVACDFEGGLEFVKKATTIDDPIFQLDAATGIEYREPSQARTTQISSIEILPSELPLDASTHFSESITPYLYSLLKDPASANAEDQFARALRRATIVDQGNLTKEHERLYAVLKDRKDDTKERTSMQAVKRQKVVLLGSGLVAAPAVKVLTSRPNVDLIIASNSLDSAKTLERRKVHEKATVQSEFLDLGAQGDHGLLNLVKSADVVLSLLPAPLHTRVAELCIAHGTDLVTASYVSPEMKALSNKAKEAGVVLLNELGLDPGIDHCSAMRMIEEAKEDGNIITSFISFCGGLPSPEQSNGPLGYKFSWSPRGVLTAATNSALFRLNQRDVSIAGADLLTSSFSKVPIIRGFQLEGLANRNSLQYLSEYGLPEDLPTVLRGTLRYPGFARVVDGFKKIGLLSTDVFSKNLESWEGLTDACLARLGGEVKDREVRLARIRHAMGVKAGSESAEEVLKTLEELHLAPSSAKPSSSNDLPALPSEPQAPIDLLSTILSSQLKYGPEERDAVILHHELGTTNKDGRPELFTSTLVQYGVPGGDSAMATTVGAPIALGALLLLDKKITTRGIVTPSHPEVWKPLLESLDDHGIRFEERRSVGQVGVLGTLEK